MSILDCVRTELVLQKFDPKSHFTCSFLSPGETVSGGWKLESTGGQSVRHILFHVCFFSWWVARGGGGEGEEIFFLPVLPM